jgi:pimeloyl-ACP methyl ester carboxylesterase
VDVWHGELDPVVPAWLGRQVAAAIPGAHAHIARNAGHLMLIDWMDEILDMLVAGTRGQPSRGPANARVLAGVG